MKRSLAVLALVLVLVAGTAGMASALTIGFDSSYPPYPPEISGITSMTWDGTGAYEGHLWCANFSQDSIISFTIPTYVNNFQMNGMPYAEAHPGWYAFGPMNIEAFTAAGGKVWSTRVENLGDYTDLGDSEYGWLTVNVNTPNISSIIFKAPNPGNLPEPYFYPSIDNLVITAAVPIPASVWLLASGLLALVGLRRKFTR